MGEKVNVYGRKGKRLWETSENPRIQRVNRSFQSKGKRLWEIFIKWLFVIDPRLKSGASTKVK